MFGALTEKFKDLFAGMTGKKTLSESNIADAVSQVRLALLDADVSFSVASAFVKRIKEKAVGEAVTKSVTPGQQFIKIVHEELIALMGAEESSLKLSAKPLHILLCGLQGSGKTTSTAKLAAYLQKKGRKPLVVACDLQRPAAIEQIKTLCATIGVPVFSIPGETNPLRVVEKSLKAEGDHDVVIFDTAGRLHLDEELMQQLAEVKEVVRPQEILFVANSNTGQDAVKTAAEFDKRLSITGTILTMLDGSSRAGAAISIREVTGKPLVFEGVGEKIADLQPFNPRSMADRILGMGDVVNLVRKAEEHFDQKEAEALEKKMRKAAFTYSDYLSQMGMMKKMGPLKNLLQMLPGGMQVPDLEKSEGELKKMEAMIKSMTNEEREEIVDIIPPRRWRIAKGSGTTIDDVNRLIKNFKKMKDLCKNLPSKKQMEKMSWF
ncbi:MAG: signal recognition particle protein [Verrucomicrobia bacterium]|nr:signal recognition particle protein [Verrucomicrobiota bacterium]